MAGVSDKGFTTKTTEEIIDDIAERANSDTYFGQSFSTSAQSVFGIHTGVLSGEFTDLWNLGQAVANQMNPDTASGVYLDYIAKIRGITRLAASGSDGYLHFIGAVGTTISQYFPVSDDEGRSVLTDEELTLNRSNCYTSTFSINTVAGNTAYTLNVEGGTYTYTSGSDDTEEDILEGLYNVLSASIIFSTELVDGTLVLANGSRNNTLTTTNSDNITLDNVGGLVVGTAAEIGSLSFPANTITTIVGSNIQIYSVTNPLDFEEGREQETDAELRIRIANSGQSTGVATLPSIEASLYEIAGVTEVMILENNSMVTDENDVPPKSYEAYVTGGDEDSIATVLWNTKPAGIATAGSITKIVLDANETQQAVKFSRRSDLYAWVKVEYTINNSTLFPADGEAQMIQAVATFGNELSVGSYFEPTQFYAPAYTVAGIYVESISIAITSSPTDTPEYTTERIPISVKDILLFDDTRVTTTTS